MDGCGALPAEGLPKGVPIIGMAANLRPIKRADILIRAFSMISERHPDARLVLVGSHHNPSPRGCSMLEYLEALAGRLGVLERIIFIGSVDNAEPYISRFTVGVLCSESEGFSNSLIEYMQAGLPVICTDTGGNGELIEDGINGFLVPVGDVDRLADRLVKVLSDSAMARRLGEAARDTARSYSVSRMIDEQMTCYDEVLSAYRSSGEVESASSAN
jgi:glycosyltransferase involved in cell wall biosynthesis